MCLCAAQHINLLSNSGRQACALLLGVFFTICRCSCLFFHVICRCYYGRGQHIRSPNYVFICASQSQEGGEECLGVFSKVVLHLL